MGFKAQLAFGKVGESHIAEMFKAIGYCVIPIYEKEIDEGKGPVVFCPEGVSLVAPDMFVYKMDKAFFIEGKHKSAFTWHRISQRWVTGIDLHHYKQYLEIAKTSPWPVWIMFLHRRGLVAKDTPDGMVSPFGLFGGELLELAEKENHRHSNHGRHGMVYWAHDVLKLIQADDE